MLLNDVCYTMIWYEDDKALNIAFFYFPWKVFCPAWRPKSRRLSAVAPAWWLLSSPALVTVSVRHVIRFYFMWFVKPQVVELAAAFTFDTLAYTHTHARTHARTHAHTHTHTHPPHTHSRAHTRTRTHARTHTHSRTNKTKQKQTTQSNK